MKSNRRIMLAALLAVITGAVVPANSIYAEEIIPVYEENTVQTESETESESAVPEEDTVTDSEDSDAEESLKGVGGFVNRLYTQVLGRNMDDAGFRNWTGLLTEHKYTAADTACGFVFSNEYKAKKTTDEEYITMLYSVMMDREPDAEGMKNWISVLEKGVSRRYVLKNFVGSDEFSQICENFGVERGSVTVKEERDKNINLTAFVQRLYTGFLGRKSDDGGMNSWTGQLLSGSMNACDVINGFIFSSEFLNRSVSDEEYTDILYTIILGREADSAGKDRWVSKLQNGYTREFILKGFTGSEEFSRICESYSVVRGSTRIKGWQKDDGGMTWYFDDGTRAADKVVNIDGYTYYFDSTGYMGNGWYNIYGRRRYAAYGYLLPDNGTDWGKAFEEGSIKYPDSYDNQMNIPVIYQFMYKEPVCWFRGVPKSVNSSGCGAASSSMVIEYLTGRTDLDPQTLFRWAYEKGQYQGYGLAEYTLTNYMKLAGIESRWITKPVKTDEGGKNPSENNDSLKKKGYAELEETLTQALRDGNPVIPLMLEGYFTTGGHYIVLSGVTDDGYYYVNDPNDSSRGRFVYSPEAVIEQAKCFMICEK